MLVFLGLFILLMGYGLEFFFHSFLVGFYSFSEEKRWGSGPVAELIQVS